MKLLPSNCGRVMAGAAVAALLAAAAVSGSDDPPPAPEGPPPDRVLEIGQPVWCVVLSPDSRTIAVGYGSRDERPGGLKLFDAASGRELASQDEPGVVRSVAYSPNGKLLATAHFDRTASLRDAATGVEKLRLRGHESGVNSVAFTPDGSILATASWDNTIRLWDTASGEERGTLRGHDDQLYSIAFSPDARWLVSGGKEGIAKIWDLVTVEVTHTLKGHTNVVEFVAFSPDSKTVTTAGWDGTLRFWNAETGKETGTTTAHKNQCLCVAFSPDGKLIASSSGRWGDGNQEPGPGEVRLCNPATREPIVALGGHADRIFTVNFSPDSKLLASGSIDGSVRLWQVRPSWTAPSQE